MEKEKYMAPKDAFTLRIKTCYSNSDHRRKKQISKRKNRALKQTEREMKKKQRQRRPEQLKKIMIIFLWFAMKF